MFKNSKFQYNICKRNYNDIISNSINTKIDNNLYYQNDIFKSALKLGDPINQDLIIHQKQNNRKIMDYTITQVNSIFDLNTIKKKKNKDIKKYKINSQYEIKEKKEIINSNLNNNPKKNIIKNKGENILNRTIYKNNNNENHLNNSYYDRNKDINSNKTFDFKSEKKEINYESFLSNYNKENEVNKDNNLAQINPIINEEKENSISKHKDIININSNETKNNLFTCTNDNNNNEKINSFITNDNSFIIKFSEIKINNNDNDENNDNNKNIYENPFLSTVNDMNKSNNINIFNPSNNNNNPSIRLQKDYINNSNKDNNNIGNPFLNIKNKSNNHYNPFLTNINNPFYFINNRNNNTNTCSNINNQISHTNKNPFIDNSEEKNKEDKNFNVEEEVRIEKDEDKLKYFKEVKYEKQNKFYETEIEKLQYYFKYKYISVGKGMLSLQEMYDGKKSGILVLRDLNSKNIRIQGMIINKSEVEKSKLKNGVKFILIKNILASYPKMVRGNPIVYETKLTYIRIKINKNNLDTLFNKIKEFFELMIN